MTRQILLAFAAAGLLATAASAETTLERGAYLAGIMDCTGCHSGRTPDGAIDPARNLTGGTLGFEMPGMGIFWPPNLTPDRTGLGDWTDEEIARAIREGVRPDGRMLAPIMPYGSYSALTDEDAMALVAYLRSLPATPNAVPGPLLPAEKAPAPYFTVAMPE